LILFNTQKALLRCLLSAETLFRLCRLGNNFFHYNPKSVYIRYCVTAEAAGKFLGRCNKSAVEFYVLWFFIPRLSTISIFFCCKALVLWNISFRG